MIEVTITFRASKDTVKKHGLLGAPVLFYDNRRFYVSTEAMGDLVQLCKQRGWEVETTPVFPSSVDQIVSEVSDHVWKEA